MLVINTEQNVYFLDNYLDLGIWWKKLSIKYARRNNVQLKINK